MTPKGLLLRRCEFGGVQTDTDPHIRYDWKTRDRSINSYIPSAMLIFETSFFFAYHPRYFGRLQGLAASFGFFVEPILLFFPMANLPPGLVMVAPHLSQGNTSLHGIEGCTSKNAEVAGLLPCLGTRGTLKLTFCRP